MGDPTSDQVASSWSDGASGYDEHFAGYTALYTPAMLDQLGVGSGTRVLDVAAGSGAASVEAVTRGASVVATDFAPGMVTVASARLAASGPGEGRAMVMDGQALDLGDGSFDVALSMFGLMFFPDVGAGVEEMGRVVRVGGRVGTATWDVADFGMHRLIGRAIDAVVPDRDPADQPVPTWVDLGTIEGLEALFDRRGLDDVRVERVTRRWTFPDPAGYFREMPEWSAPVRPMLDAMPERLLDAAAEAFADAVAAEGGRPGGPGIPMTALFATANVTE